MNLSVTRQGVTNKLNISSGQYKVDRSIAYQFISSVTQIDRLVCYHIPQPQAMKSDMSRNSTRAQHKLGRVQERESGGKDAHCDWLRGAIIDAVLE